MYYVCVCASRFQNWGKPVGSLASITCGDDGCNWATARLRTLGLAGIWFNSVNAFTVSPTLPGDVRPAESSKYAGGGGKLSDDEFITFDCRCCLKDRKRSVIIGFE